MIVMLFCGREMALVREGNIGSACVFDKQCGFAAQLAGEHGVAVCLLQKHEQKLLEW